VRDELEVKHCRKGDEDDKDWDEKTCCHPRSLVRYCVEFHPAQDGYFNQKQQNA
jgi:hypothetical protein